MRTKLRDPFSYIKTHLAWNKKYTFKFPHNVNTRSILLLSSIHFLSFNLLIILNITNLLVPINFYLKFYLFSKFIMIHNQLTY